MGQKFDPGIRQEILEGLVSEYECRTVSRASNMTWAGWCELDEGSRASEIAYSRISSAIESHVHEAAQREATRNARRNQRGR